MTLQICNATLSHRNMSLRNSNLLKYLFSMISGVRMKNEIIKEGSTASVYDELSKKENKVVMDLNFKNSAASEAIMSTLYPP